STKPASFRPCRKASTINAKPAAGVLLRNPITGIAGCCARAASGHAAAAPPRNVAKNFRSSDVACHVTLRLGVIHAMEDDTTLPSRGLWALQPARRGH